MAKNIDFMGATFPDVPSIRLPQHEGGLVAFDDTTDATATADKILQGYTAYANGQKLVGTASGGITPSGTIQITQNGQVDVTQYATADVNVSGGGGGGKNAQIANGLGLSSTTNNGYVDSGLKLTVAKSGTYNVYWVGYRSNASGTSGSQLAINDTDYGAAQETFDDNWRNLQVICLPNVSLTEGQVVSLKVKARSIQYRMIVMNLTIIEV